MKKLIYITLTLAIAILTPLFMTNPANAASFNPGRIIDDAVMTNSSSMTVSQIQSFLNSKVSTCDTWGVQQHNGTTRAAYAAARGVSTPFICLKDYSLNGKSSAQMIYDAAQKYSINPQVLIALLQKEQGLLTDDWPWPIQYRSATGYGCPDTAPCDSQYYGLANQLDWAARLFRSVIDRNTNWYSPYVVGNNYIQWSPNSACGGSTVYIENWSTAALYNYTPYRPNQAALNAGYGMGDSCSAYGNRNFHLYFTEWFGVTSYNGKAIRGSTPGSGVFMVENGTKRPFDSVEAMYSHGYSWESVIIVSDTLLNSLPIGPSINVVSAYNLRPIRSTTPGSGVYFVENGTKRPFDSVEAMYSHGYNWDKVVAVSNTAFNSIPVGSTLGINSVAWQNRAIKASTPGSGIFMIDGGVKRPFPSVEALYSNGFTWQNITAVTNYSFDSIATGAPIDVALTYYNKKAVRSTSAGSGVYLIENGIKRPFDSVEALYSHGYNWDKVVTISDSLLASFPAGSPVSVLR